MRIPNFFIVGGRKCGTTTLYALLKNHPDIFMPRAKEPHFFGSDVHARAGFTQDAYLAHFRDVTNQTRIGEASTGYLYSRLAAAEIKKFNPDARIIVMLRNPVDALYSLHGEYVFAGAEPIEDFAAALEAEERRKRERYLPPPAVSIEFLYYREWVKYAEQTQRYFDTFGRENVHVIVLDDFSKDAAAVLRETLCFLQVSPDVEMDLRVRNPNKVARSRTLQNYVQNPNRTLTDLARRLVPGNAVIRTLVWLNTKYSPRPAMDPALRRRLQAEFVPQVERLSRLLDRDLTGWSRTEPDEDGGTTRGRVALAREERNPNV